MTLTAVVAATGRWIGQGAPEAHSRFVQGTSRRPAWDGKRDLHPDRTGKPLSAGERPALGLAVGRDRLLGEMPEFG